MQELVDNLGEISLVTCHEIDDCVVRELWEHGAKFVHRFLVRAFDSHLSGHTGSHCGFCSSCDVLARPINTLNAGRSAKEAAESRNKGVLKAFGQRHKKGCFRYFARSLGGMRLALSVEILRVLQWLSNGRGTRGRCRPEVRSGE